MVFDDNLRVLVEPGVLLEVRLAVDRYVVDIPISREIEPSAFVPKALRLDVAKPCASQLSLNDFVVRAADLAGRFRHLRLVNPAHETRVFLKKDHDAADAEQDDKENR